MYNLSGQVAVVTGSGNGIGRSIATKLAHAGAHIVLIDNDKEKNLETKKMVENIGSKVLTFHLDVTDRGGLQDVVQEVTEELGDISIVVNNAGILLRGKIDDENSAQKWDKTINTNLTGAFNVTYAFLESLKRTKGSIVNMASIHSIIAVNNSIAYTASKGGISQLTKALALELSCYGIRVNAVAPGIIATSMSAGLRSDEEKLQQFLARVPLRRVGNPDEVAKAVIFLASDQSSYITGVTLPVDGGYVAN